jgi:isocitrate/isopropylmalate dehydrogenase
MEWLGMPEISRRIESAASWALKQETKTPDLGGRAKTSEVVDAVVKFLAK